MKNKLDNTPEAVAYRRKKQEALSLFKSSKGLKGLSNRYKSLKIYQNVIYIGIGINILGVIYVFWEFSRIMVRDFVWIPLITIGAISVWMGLQMIKLIDFLFDLAEQKADTSHKH